MLSPIPPTGSLPPPGITSRAGPTPADAMDLASALNYAAEVCNVLAFLVMLPGAWAAVRKWARPLGLV